MGFAEGRVRPGRTVPTVLRAGKPHGPKASPHALLPHRREYARSSARLCAIRRASRTIGRRTQAHNPPPMTPGRAALPSGRPSKTPADQETSPTRIVRPITHGISGSNRSAADRPCPLSLSALFRLVMACPYHVSRSLPTVSTALQPRPACSEDQSRGPHRRPLAVADAQGQTAEDEPLGREFAEVAQVFDDDQPVVQQDGVGLHA